MKKRGALSLPAIVLGVLMLVVVGAVIGLVFYPAPAPAPDDNANATVPASQLPISPYPPCTEQDWTSQLTPSSCPVYNSQTKSWTQVGQCAGGVSHPSSEEVSCVYSAVSCTSFTYTDWSGCNQSGSQIRVVSEALPEGCVGGNPMLTQTCTFTSPCREQDWNSALNPAICPLSGEQNRSWTRIGNCSGGVSHPDTITLSCNYRTPTCTTFVYGGFSSCSPSGTQGRSLINALPEGCVGGNPVTSIPCTYVPACLEANWSNATVPATCPPSEQQTRSWTLTGNCTLGAWHPAQENVSCTYIPPVCNSFSYTTWSECTIEGSQSRSIVSQSPEGCVGGNPMLTQNCAYPYWCTEQDWTFVISPSTCPASKAQWKVWSKTSDCEGGVWHPTYEQISCT